MSTNESVTDRPVFSLLFGRSHGPWVWTYVQEGLRRHGYDSIAPDLPIKDPDVTLDDHADIVQAAENAYGAAEYIRVPWSWAGDIGYRRIGASPVSQLIFLAAPLRPIIRNLENSDEAGRGTSRSMLYDIHVKTEEKGATGFDPILIGNAFYNELKDEALKSLAIGQLRPHPRGLEDHKVEDGGAVLPELDMHYIVCGKDHAVRPEWQKYVAERLDIDYTILPVDHASMLSFPNLLVRRLIKIVEQRKEALESAV